MSAMVGLKRETIAVSSSPVSLSASIYGADTIQASHGRVQKALISVQTAAISFTVDGTTPAAGTGVTIAAGNYIEIEGWHDISHFQAIRSSVDATLEVIYFWGA